MPLCSPYPTLFRQHDGERIRRRELQFAERLRFLALGKRRPSGISMGINDGLQFTLDERLESGITPQRFLQRVALAGQLILLTPDFHFLKLGKVAQLKIENRFGLNVRDLEGIHERGLGLIFLPDNANHLVYVEERGQIAFEDVQATLDSL